MFNPDVTIHGKTGMQFAGHLTEHAGKLFLAIRKSNLWRFTFKRIYDSFVLSASGSCRLFHLLLIVNSILYFFL